MPIIKSSKKSVKTDRARSKANNFYVKTAYNAIKKTDKAVDAKDVEAAQNNLKVAIRAIDKACIKGLMKKNTCARQKSRLNEKVKQMAS